MIVLDWLFGGLRWYRKIRGGCWYEVYHHTELPFMTMWVRNRPDMDEYVWVNTEQW